MSKKVLQTKKQAITLFFLCLSAIGFAGLLFVFYGFNKENPQEVYAFQNDEENGAYTNESTKSISEEPVDNTAKNNVQSENIGHGSDGDEDTDSAVVENTTSKVVIRMVGDSLIHEPVANSGLQSDGSYNYDHLFEHIKDDIASADLAIINQETVLGGLEIGISGYPRFNSPQEIGDAIVATGFDVVQHANNHAMDQDEYGLEKTMLFWDKHPEITVVGVSRSEEERNIPKIIEVNGIKIAVLSYTTSLNGLPLPTDKPWLVHMLTYDSVLRDIDQAKSMSDFVIVLPHWGVEYAHEQSNEQMNMARLMSEAGADLIIGTHPHVIQPVEWLTNEDGSRSLVYYSLGNYVSNQSMPARMLGGMAEVTIEKKQDDGVVIAEAEIVPLVTHYEWGNLPNSYTVYKLIDYNDTLASKNGVLREEFDSDGNKILKTFNMRWLERLSQEVLGDEWYK